MEIGYKKIKNEEYFAVNALSNSGLKEFAVSPAHFKAQDDDPSDEMALGTLVHMAVLEPEEFINKVWFGDRRTKEGRASYEQAQREGKITTTEGTYNKAKEIAHGVHKNEKARYLLTKGENELSGFALDPVHDVWMKIKPDAIHHDLKLIVDLKTCSRGMSEADLQRRMVNLKYGWQSSFYQHVNELITGEKYKFVHCFVEVKPPYAVRLRTLNEESVAMCTNQWMALLPKYKECLEANNWPGFSGDIEDMGLPAWCFNEN